MIGNIIIGGVTFIGCYILIAAFVHSLTEHRFKGYMADEEAKICAGFWPGYLLYLLFAVVLFGFFSFIISYLSRKMKGAVSRKTERSIVK